MRKRELRVCGSQLTPFSKGVSCVSSGTEPFLPLLTCLKVGEQTNNTVGPRLVLARVSPTIIKTAKNRLKEY